MALKKQEEAPKGLYLITRSIQAKTNFGDTGKQDNFLNKVRRQLNEEIENLEHNIVVEKLEYSNGQRKLKDALEDAVTAREEAFEEIDIDHIQTNTAQTAYIDTYLDKIESKGQEVARVEQNIIDDTKQFEESIEDNNKQIEAKKSQLKNIKLA